jgi:hypothetical protein
MYRKAADIEVDVQGRETADIAGEIIDRLRSK